VETQVLWMLRRMTVAQLVRLIRLLADSKTDMRKKIHDEAMARCRNDGLKSVPFETSSGCSTLLRQFRAVYRTTGRSCSRPLSEHVRQRPLPHDVRSCTATQKKCPLLRALVHHLGKQSLDLSPVHLANLSFSLATFNLYDEKLMSRIVDAFPVAVVQSTDCRFHCVAVVIAGAFFRSSQMAGHTAG